MKYEIIEHGYAFATIEADDAEEAIDLAEREYLGPGSSRDYDGYTGPVRWYARQVGADRNEASRDVEVPE